MAAFEMVDGKIVRKDETMAAAPNVSNVRVDDDDDDDDAVTVLPGSAAFAPRQAAPVQPPKAAKIAKPPKPKDIVKLARARLREVNREIARIRKLEKERDELARLVEAADNKPLAPVRGIATAKRGA